MKVSKLKSDRRGEYEFLVQNNPWRLAPLPKGKKAIKCNWVYKVKHKPNGTIEKFKARLVAKGYSQVGGVDYSETYAPVIKFDSLRIICAMVTKAQIKMEQFDVCTAFLDGDLELKSSWNNRLDSGV